MKLWLTSRLKEKSTQTALVSLGTILLHRTGLEPDLISGIESLVMAMLITSVVTKG